MSKGLEALKAAWAKAKQESKEFSNPHFNDGHYLTKIVKAEIGESKKGTHQIVVDYQFIEGEYTGKSKRDWLSLDPSASSRLAMTLGTLDRLGLSDVEPETLEEDIKQLLGKVVRIQLVTTISKKDGVTEFQNIKIEKVVGVDPEAQDASPVEDIPMEELESAGAEGSSSDDDDDEEATTAVPSEDEGDTEEEAVEEVEADEDEEGVDIEIGMKVSFLKKDGTELNGKVADIDEEAGKLVISAKDVDGKTKKFKVDADRVSAL